MGKSYCFLRIGTGYNAGADDCWYLFFEWGFDDY